MRAAREKKGWSQTYVCKKLGISNSTLSGYERNYREPDIDTLKKLAELYEVSPQWLLVGYEIEMDRPTIEAVPNNDAKTTIELLEEEAAKLGLKPSDPLFKELLSDAFKLIRLARKENSQ